jgi:hypothetical protein
MQELLIKRDATYKELTDENIIYKNCGRDFAKARAIYTIAWRKEVFRLKEIDKIASSSCNELAKGDKEVANFRFLKDVRESDRDCSKEKILILKWQLKLIEGDMLAIRQGI